MAAETLRSDKELGMWEVGRDQYQLGRDGTWIQGEVKGRYCNWIEEPREEKGEKRDRQDKGNGELN